MTGRHTTSLKNCVIATLFVKFKIGLSLVNGKVSTHHSLPARKGRWFPQFLFHSNWTLSYYIVMSMCFKELEYVIYLSKYFPFNFKFWSPLAIHSIGFGCSMLLFLVWITFYPLWAYTRWAKVELSATQNQWLHTIYWQKVLFFPYAKPALLYFCNVSLRNTYQQ